jgi:hypothetical protein
LIRRSRNFVEVLGEDGEGVISDGQEDILHEKCLSAPCHSSFYGSFSRSFLKGKKGEKRRSPWRRRRCERTGGNEGQRDRRSLEDRRKMGYIATKDPERDSWRGETKSD